MDTECPRCGVSLEDIAADGRTGSRVIMIEIPEVYDGGLFWQCPDCAGRWHRFPKGHYLRARAHKYVRDIADETGVGYERN